MDGDELPAHSAMTNPVEFEILPVTAARLDDLAALFGTSGTTRGCWCMFHIASAAEFREGYGDGNRAAFEALARADNPPMGVLAYDASLPVGWCAVGPRSRFQRAIGPRARILAGRDPAEDDDVWLAPCFFLRTGYRRRGLTKRLLLAAVELAREHDAHAVEGMPRASTEAPSVEDYLGREEVFQACGFDCIARPTPRRAVMRLDVSTD